jgi:hypothetical protein
VAGARAARRSAPLRLVEANRLPEARQALRDALAKEPTNAAALELQKQIGAQ